MTVCNKNITINKLKVEAERVPINVHNEDDDAIVEKNVQIINSEELGERQTEFIGKVEYDSEDGSDPITIGKLINYL